MKIAFHSSYLGYRGTEVALMDYAWGNQEILGHRSFSLLPHGPHAENHPVAERMRAIAPLRFSRAPGEREDILREESVDFFYCIKNGWNDGVFSPRVPTAVHAIFRESEFHGDIDAYVSSWLSGVMSYGKTPWVPHMVRLAAATGCVRSEAGIPPEDFVFGRHGGDDSFDLPWVHRAVIQAARSRPDIWFLFLNTGEFQGAAGLPNLRFLPPTADPTRKAAFLGACDAMLHGRERGETFGLSCLEFAALGKPVLTYAGSPERAHLENLGRAAVPYGNPEEQAKLLRHPERFCLPPEKDGVRKEEHREPLPEFRDYQPEAVMKKFREVFLV